jgi:hypothetical protein
MVECQGKKYWRNVAALSTTLTLASVLRGNSGRDIPAHKDVVSDELPQTLDRNNHKPECQTPS